MNQKLGDALLPVALFVWMTWAVGPYYLGVAIIIGVFALNLLHVCAVAHPPAWLKRWAMRRAKP